MVSIVLLSVIVFAGRLCAGVWGRRILAGWSPFTEKEPQIRYFTTALHAQLRRNKARLEGNGHGPCQEPQRRVGATGVQPVNMNIIISRAGTDRPNNVVAIARQTYGYDFAIAPRSLADLSPAQPRNSDFEAPL